MKEKYKRPPEEFIYPAPYSGFALCCGEKPRINFEIKNNAGQMACPKCNRQVGVWGGSGIGGLQFLYYWWNLELPDSQRFGVPEGFKQYEVRIDFCYMGGKSERKLDFAFIKVEGEKVFSFSPWTGEIRELILPKSRSMQITENSGRYFNPRRDFAVMHFFTYNYKWHKKCLELLGLDAE